MTNLPVHKIVSGGQTGVDRAALDVAIFLGIEHGGWCPLGRLAEDGVIPARYLLKENNSKDYAKRTEQNVIDSDGTLILYREKLSGGTRLTRTLAIKHQRPVHTVDLLAEFCPDETTQWLCEYNIGVLNVAGPRASSNPQLSKIAEQFLIQVLQSTR